MAAQIEVYTKDEQREATLIKDIKWLAFVFSTQGYTRNKYSKIKKKMHYLGHGNGELKLIPLINVYYLRNLARNLPRPFKDLDIHLEFSNTRPYFILQFFFILYLSKAHVTHARNIRLEIMSFL